MNIPKNGIFLITNTIWILFLILLKRRILAAVDLINDDTALITSRTQLRLSLASYNLKKNTDDLKKINKIITDATHGIEKISNISVYDPEGNLVTTIEHQMDSKINNIKDIPNRKFDIQNDANGTKLVIDEILKLNHTTVGYIKITFLLDFLEEMVRDRTGLGKSGEWLFAIRNDNGDAEFVVPLKLSSNAAFNMIIPKERYDIPITQALLGNELIMVDAVDYAGNKVMASTRYIEKLDWAVVAKIDMDEINSITNKNQFYILVFGLTIIIISAIAGAYISGYIHKAIDEGIEEDTRFLNKKNEELRELSIKDSLTELYNRRFFENKLDEEFSKAQRYNYKLSIVFLDIDDFKKINDTYGHPSGDIVLIRIADLLQKCIRKTDQVARIGGEEFCIIMNDCSSENALDFLERLRLQISDMDYIFNGTTINVTCSFGIAEYDESFNNPQDFLDAADSALYKAKRQGKNRIEIYSYDDKSISA